MFGLTVNLGVESSFKKAARRIVSDIAYAKKDLNVVVICGMHNRLFSENIIRELHRLGAYLFLWVFDESLFLECSNRIPEKIIATAPTSMRSLLRKSDLVIWLSQFDDLSIFPAKIRRMICSYWDRIYEIVRLKPLLLVNLPSTRFLESMSIDYQSFQRAFVGAVNVNCEKIRRVGSHLASRFGGSRLVSVRDTNGTDLKLEIGCRRVGVEVGTLKDYFLGGEERVMDVPAGEVYVAPTENSAHGLLVVDEVRECKARLLRLSFEKGRIASMEAKEGIEDFKRLLEGAEGEADRLAEFGVGTNHGMKLIGWSVFDEKALGTAHIAIGNNLHLGGTNKASIHLDFILHKPTVQADSKLVIENGNIVR